LFFTCQFDPCILEWLDLLAKNSDLLFSNRLAALLQGS